MVSGYDISQAGKQTVTVTYDGFSTTFEINVEGDGKGKIGCRRLMES